MTGFGSFDNSTCKRVLDLLEPGDLRLGQVVMERVAVIPGFGDRLNLIGKGEVFIEYKGEVSSRVSGVQQGVVNSGKLFTETNEQKFSLGGVQCQQICSYPGGNSI